MLLSKPVKRIFTRLHRQSAIRLTPLPFVVLSVFLSFSLILESCAPGGTRLVYPLSDRTVTSTDGHLRLRVPDGWFVPEDGGTSPGLLAWLVEENYSATMGLMEIRADEWLRKKLKAAGLELLGDLSFSLKQGRKPTAKLLKAPVVFRLNRRDFCSYEYTLDGGATIVRTVVFDTGKGFYELTVIPNAKKLPLAIRPLFDAQQVILQTMEW